MRADQGIRAVGVESGATQTFLFFGYSGAKSDATGDAELVNLETETKRTGRKGIKPISCSSAVDSL